MNALFSVILPVSPKSTIGKQKSAIVVGLYPHFSSRVLNALFSVILLISPKSTIGKQKSAIAAGLYPHFSASHIVGNPNKQDTFTI